MGDLINLQEYKQRREKEQQSEIELLQEELRSLMEEIGFPTIPESLMYVYPDEYSSAMTGDHLTGHLPYSYSYVPYYSGKELRVDEHEEDDS